MQTAKPTIAELEAIMDDEPGVIEILPDGSIQTVVGPPRKSEPRIFTLREALGDTY